NEIQGIDLNEPIGEILAKIARFPYSRIPLYRDSIEQVAGILHPRALLAELPKGIPNAERLLQLARKPYFIPESTPLMRQLSEFQRRGRRMALVVDEYGDIVGLVTIEDILEEIVGEFTSEPLESSRRVERLPDGTVRIDGRIGLRQLNRLMGWELPTDGARTLSGLIVDHLERLPSEGEQIEIETLRLRIDRVEESVVRQVTVLPEAMAKAEDAEAA
ncbi:MAG: transporter associated domain-containing protein, partial [Anaerolineae bacterium]|nr:transporter associated domain-containing protein [Anaerolineae bacterium]